MGKYAFDGGPSNIWWGKTFDISSPEAFMKNNDEQYGEALNQFFSIPEVQEWVNAGDWQAVFNEWLYDAGDPYGYKTGLDIGGVRKLYRQWICDVLGMFLYLLGIEFMSHLDDDFVQKNFVEANYRLA